MTIHPKHVKSTLLSATLGGAIALAGCASDDPNQRAKAGAAIGAVVGAVAGHQADDDKGRYYGAVIGAIAGGAVGNYMDRQQRKLEQELAAEESRNELSITRLSGNALKIGIASDASFEFNSAEIQPNASATYSKIAQVLQSYDKTIVHVVGHTDTSGSAEYNQQLSQRRAAAVASTLQANAIPAGRTQTSGRGESEPLVQTGDGVKERRNRRVDIVIQPVIEGQEQAAYQPPPYLGG